MHKFLSILALVILFSLSSTTMATDNLAKGNDGSLKEVIDIDWGIGDDDSGSGYD